IFSTNGTFITNSGAACTLAVTNTLGVVSNLANITGPITLLARDMQVRNTNLEGLGAGGTILPLNTNTFTGGLVIDNGQLRAGSTAADIILNGAVSGPGRLMKADGNRLILRGANIHTGDTVFTNAAGVGQGTIRLENKLALQNSTFDATGMGGNGTLDLNNLD